MSSHVEERSVTSTTLKTRWHNAAGAYGVQMQLRVVMTEAADVALAAKIRIKYDMYGHLEADVACLTIWAWRPSAQPSVMQRCYEEKERGNSARAGGDGGLFASCIFARPALYLAPRSPQTLLVEKSRPPFVLHCLLWGQWVCRPRASVLGWPSMA